MKCCNCSREIEENSLYCNWCGAKQIQEKKKQIRVPAPRQLASGEWYIQLRIEGRSIPVHGDTEEACRAKAMAVKTGVIKEAAASRATVSAAIDRFIADRQNALSPVTIRGYRGIQKNRFQKIMNCPISEIKNWQAVVNEEAALCKEKTLKNAWALLHSVLQQEGISVSVMLPKVPKAERPWLEPDEINRFLSLIHGQPCEIPALLALHSLRRSEIFALTWEHVDLEKRRIFVQGAAVPDENGEIVLKPQNKNDSSRRVVHIFIPALFEALSALPEKSGLVCRGNINTPYKQIVALCKQNGLPVVGLHGLRHSFASLCYSLGISELATQQMGGWSDANTIHKVYLHLAQRDKDSAVETLEEFYKN